MSFVAALLARVFVSGAMPFRALLDWRAEQLRLVGAESDPLSGW